MSFNYDRIPCCQCRSCVASGNRERERKVAGAKDDDRPQRQQHRSDVRFGRSATWIVAIDARINPRTFFDHFGEQAKLITRAPGLTLDPRRG